MHIDTMLIWANDIFTIYGLLGNEALLIILASKY